MTLLGSRPLTFLPSPSQLSPLLSSSLPSLPFPSLPSLSLISTPFFLLPLSRFSFPLYFPPPSPSPLYLFLPSPTLSLLSSFLSPTLPSLSSSTILYSHFPLLPLPPLHSPSIVSILPLHFTFSTAARPEKEPYLTRYPSTR